MTYGAPTNLDLSACTLSTDGGKTSQTLAALGTAVAGNATAVAAAQTDAADAKTQAAQASEDAEGAKTAVGNLGATYIPQTALAAKNGVPQLEANGQYVSPPSVGGVSWVNVGGFIRNSDGSTSLDPNCNKVLLQYGLGAFSQQVVETVWGGTSGGPYKAFNGSAFHPETDGSASLGLADHAWNNIYSKTAVQVTSDMTQKTLIGQVGADSFAEATTLAKALSGVATIGYKLNDAIAAKGADAARVHFGFSAQDIWAAIVGAGLDPSKYALITKSPVYVVKDTPTDKKQADGTPITTRTVAPELDANGAQVYRLMLRYDQIYALLIWYQAQQQSALEARIAALEAKASTTTTTATTATTTGSAA